MVVPCATEASGALPTSIVSPCITPRAGLAGVVGTFPLDSRPDGARTTKSVNVPPTSMPTLLPVMRETVTRDPGDEVGRSRPSPHGVERGAAVRGECYTVPTREVPPSPPG